MNKIYKIISEEINKLIEEGKDPIELINYKFRNVPEDVRTKVLEADPTKKKTYTQWALTLYLTDGFEADAIENYLYDDTLEELFKRAQENKLNVKDLKSITDIEDVLDAQDNEQKYKVLYDSPQWQILQPLTAQAARKLGQYTNWCTAGSDYETHWDDFNEMGPLFINIDKRKTEQRPVGKNNNGQEEYKIVPVKYQFSFDYDEEDYGNFEWYKGMFCDADNKINLAKYGEEFPQKIDMPKEVEKFYNNMGYFFNEYGDGRKMEAKKHIKDGVYLGDVYMYSIYLGYNPQNGKKELFKDGFGKYKFMEELGEINDKFIGHVGDEETMNSFIIMKYNNSNEYYIIYYNANEDDTNVAQNIKQYILLNNNTNELFCITQNKLLLITDGFVSNLLDNVEGITKYNSNNIIAKDYNNKYYVIDTNENVTNADEEEINFYNQNNNSITESIKKEFFKKYNLIEKIIKNNQTLL